MTKTSLNRRTRIAESDHDDIAKLYKSGQSVGRIAKNYNAGSVTINAILSKLGIQMREKTIKEKEHGEKKRSHGWDRKMANRFLKVNFFICDNEKTIAMSREA